MHPLNPDGMVRLLEQLHDEAVCWAPNVVGPRGGLRHAWASP